MILNWKTTKNEAVTIVKLAQRANQLAKNHGIDYKVLEADMDISACHLNGCPLDFAALSDFNDANFAHDVFGIRRHINRSTGKLQDCFVPRCAY